jgi:putative membrane protein
LREYLHIDYVDNISALELIMKRILLVGGLVFLAAATATGQTARPASEAPQKPYQTAPAKGQKPTDAGPRPQQVVADRAMVLEAAKGGLTEVALSRLAVKRAANPAVRQFGEQMAAAHGKTNGELASLAKAKRMTLPTQGTVAQKGTLVWLRKLSGAAFDRAYMAAMVAEHTRELVLLERVATMAYDPDLKAWGEKTLPSVHEHQKTVKSINLKLAALAPETAKTAKGQKPDGPGALRQAAADSALLLESARGGITEVALGRLAVQKATDRAVREFGQQMVDAHSKTNGELLALAATKRITVPTTGSGDQKATLDRLSGLSGYSFDRAFMTEMVDKHTGERGLMQRLAERATNPDLKAWGEKTTPSVMEHQKMAYDISRRLAGPSPKTR